MNPGEGTGHGDGVQLGKLVLEDVRGGKLGQVYRRDLRDIYRFYLTDEQRERLAGMGRVKRFFWIVGWLARLEKPPKTIFLTHGEPDAALALAERLRRERGLTVRVPRLGEIVSLETRTTPPPAQPR